MEFWERLLEDVFVYFNVKIYNIMISGLSKCGRVDDCLKIWERMKENEREKDLFIYSSMIYGLCGVGSVDKVESVFNELVESKVFIDVVIYNIMFDGFCCCGEIKKSLELWRVME